ncbi:hypothetical protein [Roseovarius salinarum]|uniref:hypothetical protein n=1 Tax=Roseovarius salinarum TaxID=1981892 RepID=UPI0018E4C818|nr:hypothetical protein [Roseovarius salinarum]
MIWIIVLSALFVIPFWRLLPDYGMPAWLAVFAVIPVGALVLLYAMAFWARRTGER